MKDKNATTPPKKSNDIAHRRAKFLLSAGHYRDLPKPAGVEYCIMGRSNVGKSSFINHVLESGKLARISKTPGKTNCANLFKIDNKMIWVDLPGYGYAKVSRSEKMRWSQLIRDYCEKRENLYGIIWLLDIRHVGMRADIEAYNWFCSLDHPLFPIITKCDKLPQGKRTKQIQEIADLFHFESPVITYSIHKHALREQFWRYFNAWRELVEYTRNQ